MFSSTNRLTLRRAERYVIPRARCPWCMDNFADRAVLHTDDDNDVLTLTNLVFSTHSRFDLGTGLDQAVLNNVTFPAGKPQSVIIGGLGV
ncbi:MAG: hypothetical protein NZ914_15310, partial [Gemmatales bacterium]|nr:hypothetical protein [Gemmatales bacterium]